MGEYDGKVAEVDWKHTVDCLRKQNVRCSVEDCVSFGSTALHAGRVLGDMVCPCCGVSQLEGLTSLLTTAMLVSTVATLGNLILCALQIRWLL